MDKEHLNSLLEKLNESQEKKNKSYFNHFKSISTLSVALFGLLIGLKYDKIPNQCAKIYFLSSIILIGFCILFSLATQLYEVIYYNKEVEIRRKHILKYVENPIKNNLQIDTLSKSNLYKVFAVLTYTCLILSMITLTFYVYFLEFHIPLIK